jgi:hypothetical protein
MIHATLSRSTSACSLASSLSASWAAVILGPSAIVVVGSSISWNRPTILSRRGGRTHIRSAALLHHSPRLDREAKLALEPIGRILPNQQGVGARKSVMAAELRIR